MCALEKFVLRVRYSVWKLLSAIFLIDLIMFGILGLSFKNILGLNQFLLIVS